MAVASASKENGLTSVRALMFAGALGSVTCLVVSRKSECAPQTRTRNGLFGMLVDVEVRQSTLPGWAEVR
jgi:hypothetical protein